MSDLDEYRQIILGKKTWRKPEPREWSWHESKNGNLTTEFKGVRLVIRELTPGTHVHGFSVLVLNEKGWTHVGRTDTLDDAKRAALHYAANPEEFWKAQADTLGSDIVHPIDDEPPTGRKIVL